MPAAWDVGARPVAWAVWWWKRPGSHSTSGTCPDFPQPGVIFKDLTPLLGDADAFRFAIDAIADHFAGVPIDRVIGIEARGLHPRPRPSPTGAVPAFVPVRKAGKLPWAVAREEYSLEYGTDKLEIHRDGDPCRASGC